MDCLKLILSVQADDQNEEIAWILRHQGSVCF